MFFVYVLQNSKGTFYIGHTGNFVERLRITIGRIALKVITLEKTDRGNLFGVRSTNLVVLPCNVSAKLSA